MFNKSVLVVLVCTAAFAAGNPAAGVEWRWKPRHPTVTANVMALPFTTLVETFTPKVFIPGTKAVAGCGPVVQEHNTRIVGGQEATEHAYPWQVALFIDDLYFCGGSIINDEWILTAAHCMADALSVEVVAGAHNIQQAEATQVSIVSTNFFVHEDWVSALIRNDISLIRLPTKLTWTSAIAPVCLPARSDAELATGTLVNPSGWGKTREVGGISDVLMEVTVPIIEHTECSDYYGTSIVTENVICIDSTGGMGTCNGDSGGPMNYVTGGRSYTRGIVSFGASAGCTAGFPDAFTRVLSYLDWIETNTGIIIDN